MTFPPPLIAATACVALAGCASQQSSTHSAITSESTLTPKNASDTTANDPSPYFIVSFDADSSPRTIFIPSGHRELIVRSRAGSEQGHPELRYKETGERLDWWKAEAIAMNGIYLITEEAAKRPYRRWGTSYEFPLSPHRGRDIELRWDTPGASALVEAATEQ